MGYRDFELPDGTFVEVPSDMPFDQADALAKQKYPDAYKGQVQPASKGGYNNIGSLISGVGNVVQVPGQLAGLAGLAAPDNALVKAGQGIKDYGQSLKSEERKEQELKIALAIQEAEKLGLTAEVTETLKQYASNPGVTLGMLVEQIPMLAATMGSGLGAQLGAKALVAGIGKEGLKRAGVAGAAGAGATMQGADVGAETYDRVYKAAVAKGFTPEAAHERALGEARKAALKAGAVSGATMAFLPGAEKALMGMNPAKTALRGAGRTGLGESVQEAAEEGSGAYFANVGEQSVDPTVDTTRGVGSRTTTGAILGGLMGGATGAYSGQQEARKAKAEARAVEDAQAEAAASQEEEKKKQVEAAKDTPQYLLELDSKFQERNKTLADLTARIKAYGKPDSTSAEALEKKQLEEQKRKLVKDTEPLKEEFVARRPEIERAKKDPQDFMMESLLKEPTVSAGSPTSLKAIREKIAAQQAEALNKPAPEVEQTKKELASIMAGLQNYANITGGNITAADVLEKLTPELVAAAQKHKLTLPGMDPASSALLVKTAAKDFEKAQKADLTATMQQRQADLTAQATTATQETDPLAMLKESMAEQEEFQNTGEQNFDYLDNVFEKALGESNETGPRKVALPEGVRPVHNAGSILDRVDSLYAERDMADKDLDLASRSGNKEAAMAAAARREKANTTLLGLVDTTPVAGGIVQERKKQEGAMADVAALLDELKNKNDPDYARFNTEKVKGNEGTLRVLPGESSKEELKKEVAEARQQYVQAVIQEAAITRAAFGKALTEREALQAAAEIQRVFNEWVTRAGALPKEMAEEERVKVPAQMRGTEIVRGAEMEKFDPRPLAERRLGAYRAATEVFQDQINRIVAPLVSVREEGQRVEQPLRMQFATSEAAKTAEARGETAQTRGGELRRRREYVGNLIERALTTRDTLPSITRGLQAAKDAIDAGQGGTDVVSDIEGQRFTAGLLDAAEELSTRVIEGRKERTQNDKLLREIAANVGRQFTYTSVKNEGNISRTAKSRAGQPVSILRGQMQPPGEVVEGQQSLFDPAPLEQKQEATRERIAKLEKQVADLKAGKFQALKEGVSAAKRISGLEKAIKILQDDKKVGIDADVRAMRKEYARLQGDLGFFRATAANFEKAPEVNAGRKAVEQARAIKAAWDAIDARTEKERVDLKDRLDAIDARLSDFAWVKEAKKAGPVEIDEMREAEMAALQAERAEKGAVVAPTKGPKTAEELARDKIKQQVLAVRRAYQEAVLRALGNLKNQAMTPDMQAKQQEAETAVQGAFTWLRELTAQKDAAKLELDRQKREVAKKEAELENEEGAEGLRLVLAGMVPGMNRLAKEQIDVLEQRIALEEQRLDAASKTLEEIRDQVRESWNGANLNAEAATDKTVAFEKLNLDYFANQLREQGYVVDVEKGTVETARGTPATQQAAELRRQKEALAQAEATQTNFAAQADAMRPLQQGLGLPGTRVKSKRDQYGRVTRDIERIPSITEQDEAARAAREEAKVQAEEERAATKAVNDAARAAIQTEIDALTKQADDKRAEIQAAPNKRAQKPLEKELQAILAQLGARKLALDNVGKKRTFRQQPMTREQTSAPLNMRTGTPESRDVTMKARASNTKKLTAKEESALAKALAKQKVRDEAPTDFEPDDDISGFGTSPDVYFSRGATPTKTTIKNVVDELDKALGETGLIRGKVEVLERPSDITSEKIPDDARGAVIKGKAYLFANNIEKGSSLAVLLHEVGAHLGFKNLFNAQQYGQLASLIRSWAAKKDGSVEARIAKAAMLRVKEAGTSKNQLDDEIIAYAIEEAVNAGILPDAAGPIQRWLRTIVNALKKALNTFGITPDKLTAKDLVDMAFGAANLELRGTWHGTGKKFDAFDHSFMGTGEGAQAFGWGTYIAQKYGVAETYKKLADRKIAEAKKWNETFGDETSQFTIDGKSLEEFNIEHSGEIDPEHFDGSNAFDSALLAARRFEKTSATKEEAFIKGMEDHLAVIKRQKDYAQNRLTILKARPQNAAIKKDIRQKQYSIDRIDVEIGVLEAALKKSDTIAFTDYEPSTMARVMRTRPDTDFMGWDVAEEDQPQTVKQGMEEALASLSTKELKQFNTAKKTFNTEDGHGFYKSLTLALQDRAIKEIGPGKTTGEIIAAAQKHASLLLNEKGIAGTKFLDNQSRFKPITDKSTFNYVLYSDKDAEIVGHDFGNVSEAKEPLFSRAVHASSDIEEASNTFIGRDKGKLAAIREAASGLSIRTRFVDNYAALKEALKRGDATYAIQVMYDLMNYAQRNHMVQQSVMEGPPVRVKSKHKGKDVRMVEAQEGGPTLRRVSELLAAVKGFGNHQATSDAFTMYALAKRAETRGWDRVFADTAIPPNASQVTADKIRAENAKKAKARAQADALAADKNSPFLAAYKEYQAWNKGMLQFAQQAGVIKEEDFRRLASEGNYTPLFRKDKHGNLVLEIDQGRDITVGRLADEPHLQKLLGGSGQVMDFFTASVRNASVLVDAALHNIASREAALALEAMGAAHPISENEKNENTIEFRKDGDLQRFAVDTSDTAAADIPTDLLTKGFAGVPASLPGWVRLMGVPAQLLRKTVTRNPLYMFRQLVRDPLSAWLATGADMNPLTDTLAQVGKSLTGKSDKTLDRRGITGGMLFSENDMDIERIQNEAKKAPAWSWGYWMAKLDHAAMGADAITRRNVYQGALREGASEIQATLAAYEAMPFSKRGSSPSVRSLNHMVPFLSAAIQGWDVLYRSLFTKDMPLADRVDVRNKLLARGAMIGAMTMMYAMAMGDDDVYKNANTAERLSNWFVKIPGTDITIKLPTPFEYGILFKMIPEAMVRSATQDKEFGDEMRAVGGALWQMVPNVVLPQGVIPLVEAQQNTSFFTGRPIEGRALQDIDIGLRADRNTSELSKLVGFDFEAFGTQWGISPKMLEHVLGQYTAGLYPAFAALIDNILPAPTVDKPDRTLAELPLFKSALQQEDAGGQVNRLYDKIDKFTRYSETFKKLVETNPVEAQEYMADNAENIAKGGMAAKMKAAIDKISNAENVVRNSTMTAAQKKTALDNFKRVKTNLSSQFASAL
jgi:hypothetical protein